MNLLERSLVERTTCENKVLMKITMNLSERSCVERTIPEKKVLMKIHKRIGTLVYYYA